MNGSTLSGATAAAGDGAGGCGAGAGAVAGRAATPDGCRAGCGVAGGVSVRFAGAGLGVAGAAAAGAGAAAGGVAPAAGAAGGDMVAPTAVLQDDESLATLRCRHSRASRPPGCTPEQFAMKSERQDARMALACADVGCCAWAGPSANAASSPAATTVTKSNLSDLICIRAPHGFARNPRLPAYGDEDVRSIWRLGACRGLSPRQPT